MDGILNMKRSFCPKNHTSFVRKQFLQTVKALNVELLTAKETHPNLNDTKFKITPCTITIHLFRKTQLTLSVRLLVWELKI